MNGFDRIHDVHRLLKGRKTAMPLRELLDGLECSKATFFRIKRHMTDYLGAPIEYSRELGGYHYKQSAGEGYELPGVWFNEQELHALLLIKSLAANFGVLKDLLAPIEQRFDELLGKNSVSAEQIQRHIRFLGVATRIVGNAIFMPVVSATLKQSRLHIVYQRRDSGERSSRQISPQRIINYRNNWYLDAWCHQRNALRTFSLECILETQASNEKYKSLPEQELNAYYQTSYGLFSGGKVDIATVRFCQSIAHRVADEQWHPDQRGKMLSSGEYEMEIPYNLDSPDELIKDILAQGNSAEVIAPTSLRSIIHEALVQTLAKYDEKI